MDLYRDARVLPYTLRGRNLALTWRELDAYGITKGAACWSAARGRIDRVHRGAYLIGQTRPDLLDRVRAALLVSPPDAVLGYQTAAALLGFGVVPSGDVHLVVPEDSPFPQRPGITVHRSAVPVGEPTLVHGVPCTPGGRCALDLARTLGRPDALSILDAALGASACTPEELARDLKLHSGLRGVRQARDLVPLADPRAECRQESHLRLILLDGGVTGLHPQVEVGGYRLDLGDPRRKIGVEYDGASHLDRDRLRHDRARHNWLADRGWRLRYFTDRDLNLRPETIVRTVLAARRTPR